MPRTEEANQRIREAQREKILDAARKVFAQKGRSATMADVATEAEVSQGLAYRYFASKEVLFRTLVEQQIESGDRLKSRLFQLSGTPGERLDFLISSMVNSRREEPELYQLLYQLIQDETLPPGLKEKLQERGRLVQNVLRQLIVEGQATGEVTQDDPDQLVVAVIACIQGLWQGMVQVEPEEVRKHFPEAKIILRMLKLNPNSK